MAASLAALESSKKDATRAFLACSRDMLKVGKKLACIGEFWSGARVVEGGKKKPWAVGRGGARGESRAGRKKKKKNNKKK